MRSRPTPSTSRVKRSRTSPSPARSGSTCAPRPARIAWSRMSSSAPCPATAAGRGWRCWRSEEHTSELQSRFELVCRTLLEKKNKNIVCVQLLIAIILQIYLAHLHIAYFPTRRSSDLAVDLAREALEDVTEPGQVGQHLRAEASADRLVTHVFECTMPGYRGWSWVAVLARAPRAKFATVARSEERRVGKGGRAVAGAGAGV